MLYNLAQNWSLLWVFSLYFSPSYFLLVTWKNASFHEGFTNWETNKSLWVIICWEPNPDLKSVKTSITKGTNTAKNFLIYRFNSSGSFKNMKGINAFPFYESKKRFSSFPFPTWSNALTISEAGLTTSVIVQKRTQLRKSTQQSPGKLVSLLSPCCDHSLLLDSVYIPCVTRATCGCLGKNSPLHLNTHTRTTHTNTHIPQENSLQTYTNAKSRRPQPIATCGGI